MSWQRRSMWLLVVACALVGGARGGEVEELKQRFEAREYAASDGGKLLYRLMRPKGYDAAKTYPLVLVLHGAGGRGDDNWGQIRDQAGPFQGLADDAVQAKHPCIVVAPQCPKGKQWVGWPWGKGSYSVEKVPMAVELKRVVELLGQLASEFRIDPDRVYVTGLSMGGFGAWDIILREPKRFAAAIAVCGAGDPSQAGRIKHVPVWAFHGDKDGVVPVSGSREMVAALKKAGATPKYNEYPGVGHGSWYKAYATPGLWDWLFAQRRKKP